MKKLFLLLSFLFYSVQSFAVTAWVDDNGVATWANCQGAGPISGASACSMATANSNASAADLVNIRTGTYNTSIAPVNSGTSGNEITFIAYNSEVVTIDGALYGANLDDRSYIVLDGLIILDTTNEWVSMDSSHYNTIQNCHMEVSANYVGIRLTGAASYNKILDNILIAYCTPKDIITLRSGARYNLIEGNHIYYAPHTAIGSHTQYYDVRYNIFRYNYIQNKWHHGLAFEGSIYILAENNIIVDSGDDKANNSCGTQHDRDMARDQQKGLSPGLSWGIIRNNVMINGGFGLIIHNSNTIPEVENVVMYNNTCNANYYNMRAASAGDYAVSTVAVKNNIFSNGVDYNIYIGVTNQACQFINNNFYNGTEVWNSAGDTKTDNVDANPFYMNATGSGTTSLMLFPGTGDQATYGITFKEDAITVPIDRRDLRLQSSSTMIDGGAFLTETASNCAGGCTDIPVDDARYFMDGWGIITGDTIQLEELQGGAIQTAIVTGVNYDTNILTVDTTLYWTIDKGIGLQYEGVAPDIGAYESPGAIAITGTIAPVGGVLETAIVAGGTDIVITLNGTTWVTTVGDNNGITTALIAGLDSDLADATGWDAVVKVGLAHGDVVRTNDTVITITLPAFAAYDITSTEIITATIPATAVESATEIIADNTFSVGVDTSPPLTGKIINFSITGQMWVDDSGGIVIIGD